MLETMITSKCCYPPFTYPLYPSYQPTQFSKSLINIILSQQMFRDLRKAGGGRDGELLSWKVGSSNMHMENYNLHWNQERKIIQSAWHCSLQSDWSVREQQRYSICAPRNTNKKQGVSDILTDCWHTQFTVIKSTKQPGQGRQFLFKLFQPLHHDNLQSPSSSITYSAARP